MIHLSTERCGEKPSSFSTMGPNTFSLFFISWRFYILLKNVPWIRWDITKIIMRLQNSFCSIVVYLVQEVRYFYVKIKPPIKIKCRLQFSSSWYVLSGKGNAHHFPCMCWSPFWTISSSWSENFTILLRGDNGFNKLLESHFKIFNRNKATEIRKICMS